MPEIDRSSFALGAAEDPRGDLVWGTIPGLVAWAGERFGDDEAIVDGDVRLSFAELASAVDEVATGMLAMGVEAGDRVAIWAPNCLEWILGALGAVRAGAIIVTLNTRYKGGEASFILRASGARWLLTVRGFLGADYPALLVGEDIGSLEQIVVLKGDAEGDAPSGTTVSTLATVVAAAEA